MVQSVVPENNISGPKFGYNTPFWDSDHFIFHFQKQAGAFSCLSWTGTVCKLEIALVDPKKTYISSQRNQ